MINIFLLSYEINNTLNIDMLKIIESIIISKN